MADFKKRADELISNYRRDIENIHRKYNPGVDIPGEFTGAAADTNEDTLKQQQEARSLSMEKTHKINPATGQWEPISKPYSRSGFKSSANENYWLRQAQNQGLDVKSIDDVIVLQKSLGVTADGKWGKASMAAYQAKQGGQKPSPYITGNFEQEQQSPTQEQTQSQFGFLPEPFVPGTDYSKEKPVTQRPTSSSYADYVRNVDRNYGPGAAIRGLFSNMREGIRNGQRNQIERQNERMQREYEQRQRRRMMKSGGAINRFQQGGQIQPQNEQEAFVQYIAQIFGVKTQEDLKKVVSQLGKQGMQQLQAAFKQGVSPEQIRNQMGNNQQAQYAKRGARICPDGTRLVFKAGGCMCQKMEEGGQTKKRFTAKPPIKKKTVNPNDTIHVNGKPRDISGGKTKYPKLSNSEYRKLPASKKTDVDLKDQATGRSVPQRRFGGLVQRFKKGGQMGGEFQDGIGMKSFVDTIVGRPANMKCGGKTRKKLVAKKK